VGDGGSNKVWLDEWLGDAPLCEQIVFIIRTKVFFGPGNEDLGGGGLVVELFFVSTIF
jgi:hypothetical protein